MTHRAAAYVAHGALDHVQSFLVDGVVTTLGWLRQSLLSPSLEPNWHVVNPAYSEMTALALGLVIAFVALALLEHMSGGVRGAVRVPFPDPSGNDRRRAGVSAHRPSGAR